MLLAYDRLLRIPVMSLQTGAELARTSDILVDPRDLTIAAYVLEGHMLDEHPSFLRPVDVRELSALGLIVDSSDEFVGLADVIKIKEVYELQFKLIGLEVISERKKKLGKVSGFTIDSGSFSVQQLTVKRPLLKSFNDTELIIHRSQVIEIGDTYIKVKTPSVDEAARTPIREYTNPFRTGSVQPETINAENQWP